MEPPRAKVERSALPAGVHWTPVDEVHEHLRSTLTCVTATERMDAASATGRFLAEDVRALRSNPPSANSAVDGYGFAGPAPAGVRTMPVVEGRAVAGSPFERSVPKGSALRILTGACLPAGVDTVVLEEDVTVEGGAVAFHGPVRRGANTRSAGEDVPAGEVVLAAGTRLGPPHVAILTAVGIREIPVRCGLRVGVLSTGNELSPVGVEASPDQIFDANRPMLMSLVDGWGFQAVDLGHVRDDREELRKHLDHAAVEVDAILTSGGASAGDEDHVSGLLNEAGTMALWRVAMKPGRPLALAVWQGVPVFALPGNPVAAFVCALVFAEPAFRRMAGDIWRLPHRFVVPAAFTKSKKSGRREYLRARLTGEGAAEVFGSEGSGRISGLAWASGLVELDDGACDIRPGDPVRFLPFSGCRAD